MTLLFRSLFILVLGCAVACSNAGHGKAQPNPQPAQPTIPAGEDQSPGTNPQSPEKEEEKPDHTDKAQEAGQGQVEAPTAPAAESGEKAASAIPPSSGGKPKEDFVRVTSLDPTIRLDIRYATTDNFTKAKIYDCPECLLRKEAAAAIVKAHQLLKQQGMGLKMFDCYRPRPYQQRLWDKVPNPDYVTPPAKGSMHSRGAAVDLTIVDRNGKELDMGTPYDFFGEQAHYDFLKLPEKVLANRRLLRKTLESVGFQGIRTEWWHFSFKGKNYPLSEYVWDCE